MTNTTLDSHGVTPPSASAMVGPILGVLILLGGLVGGYFLLGSESPDAKGKTVNATLPSPVKSVQEDGMSVGTFDNQQLAAWLESVDLPGLTPNVPAIEWGACVTFYDGLKAVDTLRSADAYGFAGMCFHYYDLFNEARQCYLKANDLAPDNHKWVHYLGYLEMNVGQFKKAEEWFKKALDRDPSYASTYMQLGYLYAQETRDDEAHVMYTKSREFDPGNPFPCTEIADIEIKRGNFYRAEELCKEALSYRPGDKRAFSLLAIIFGRTDRSAEAERAIFQAGEGVTVTDPVPDQYVMDLRKETNALSFKELLAEVRFKQKEWDLLKVTLEEIIERDPRLIWRYQLGNTLIELKDWDGAESQAQYARRKEPRSAGPHEVLGRIDFHRGRDSTNHATRIEHFTKAIGHFEDAVKLDPRAAMCWEMKLRAHGELKQHSLAIQASEELLKLDQSNWKGHRYRGKVFYNMGEEIYKAYEKLAKIKGREELSKEQLHKSMLAFKESFTSLNKASKINPVHEGVAGELQTITHVLQHKISAHPEYAPPGMKPSTNVPHDHDGDGIPDHAPGDHPESKTAVPHDHDGDGKPDH